MLTVSNNFVCLVRFPGSPRYRRHKWPLFQGQHGWNHERYASSHAGTGRFCFGGNDEVHDAGQLYFMIIGMTDQCCISRRNHFWCKNYVRVKELPGSADGDGWL